jgi:hypothetical protein
MKGFKDSTKMKYMGGGGMADAPMKKAMGGSVVKPMMDKPMMAKGGDTKPMMKKVEGGMMSKRPSAGESVASSNRMSRMEAEKARAMGLKKGGLAVMPKKGKC